MRKRFIIVVSLVLILFSSLVFLRKPPVPADTPPEIKFIGFTNIYSLPEAESFVFSFHNPHKHKIMISETFMFHVFRNERWEPIPMPAAVIGFGPERPPSQLLLPKETVLYALKYVHNPRNRPSRYRDLPEDTVYKTSFGWVAPKPSLTDKVKAIVQVNWAALKEGHSLPWDKVVIGLTFGEVDTPAFIIGDQQVLLSH